MRIADRPVYASENVVILFIFFFFIIYFNTFLLKITTTGAYEYFEIPTEKTDATLRHRSSCVYSGIQLEHAVCRARFLFFVSDANNTNVIFAKSPVTE